MLYLCKEVDLEAGGLVGFRLAVIQIIPHSQHKLEQDNIESVKVLQ